MLFSSWLRTLKTPLVGSHFGDLVGGNDGQGVTALTNGNYVVDSPIWNNQEGAVTGGNGTTGITGTVSAANSLVGSTPSNGHLVIGDQGSITLTFTASSLSSITFGTEVVVGL